jgi:hypothetical protein
MTEYLSIYRRYSIMICVLQPNALMPIVGRPIAVMPNVVASKKRHFFLENNCCEAAIEFPPKKKFRRGLSFFPALLSSSLQFLEKNANILFRVSSWILVPGMEARLRINTFCDDV